MANENEKLVAALLSEQVEARKTIDRLRDLATPETEGLGEVRLPPARRVRAGGEEGEEGMTNEQVAADWLAQMDDGGWEAGGALTGLAGLLDEAQQRGAAAVSCRMADAITAAEQRGREQAAARIAELEGLLSRAIVWSGADTWDRVPVWVEEARAALAKGGAK